MCYKHNSFACQTRLCAALTLPLLERIGLGQLHDKYHNFWRIVIMDRFIKFLRDEEGATAIEYALIAGLIAVGLVLALTNIGTELKRVFTDIYNELVKVKPTSGA